MAFREVRVSEVREVLRLWLRGEGFRVVERLSGVDRKTVRRYVTGTVVSSANPSRWEAAWRRSSWSKRARRGSSGSSCSERTAACLNDGIKAVKATAGGADVEDQTTKAWADEQASAKTAKGGGAGGEPADLRSFASCGSMSGRTRFGFGQAHFHLLAADGVACTATKEVRCRATSQVFG